ncbi:hypothetical protein [uncultured Sphingomonas sp.]|uniref:hypothetical protein n=1 Tax=uncultured Sphingomonas sp. TaxID=158754 RepID=UPI0025869208|nr:hypothetical protein [uncultured Sphingomonas sp.]
MAVVAPTTGAPLRASEINRRGLLAGLTLAPALAVMPPAANAADRWEILHARFERAAEAALTFHETVYQVERERIDAMAGEQPPLWFEHTTRSGQTARFAVVPGKQFPFASPLLDRLHDEAAANWEAWRERDDRVERDPRWLAVDREMSRLWDVENDARVALMHEPAPHGRALALKVQLAIANDDLWDEDRVALLEDVRRMAV